MAESNYRTLLGVAHERQAARRVGRQTLTSDTDTYSRGEAPDEETRNRGEGTASRSASTHTRGEGADEITHTRGEDPETKGRGEQP